MIATIENAKQSLIYTVEVQLPEFVKAVKKNIKHDCTRILMNQDAFATDFSGPELLLLGMAIKYAGIHGCAIEIIPHKVTR